MLLVVPLFKFYSNYFDLRLCQMSFFGEKCSKLLVVIIIVLVIDVLDIDNNYLKNIYLWSYVLLQLCNLGIIIMFFSCP